MRTHFNILYSDMQDPILVSDGKKLGRVSTEWQDQDESNMEGILEWHFYDTMIKIAQYSKKHPNNRHPQYITNF